MDNKITIGQLVYIVNNVTGKRAYGRVVGFGRKNVKVQFKNFLGEYITRVDGVPMTEMVPAKKLHLILM
jgi:hypothetical protein